MRGTPRAVFEMTCDSIGASILVPPTYKEVLADKSPEVQRYNHRM